MRTRTILLSVRVPGADMTDAFCPVKKGVWSRRNSASIAISPPVGHDGASLPSSIRSAGGTALAFLLQDAPVGWFRKRAGKPFLPAQKLMVA